MAYRLIIAPEYAQRFDECVDYLLNKKSNRQAASHLIGDVELIYKRLEDDPFQFPFSNNELLAQRGYRKAVLSSMQYVIMFKIAEDTKSVHIEGIFHDLENYQIKI